MDIPWPFLHNLENLFILAAYVQLLVGYAYCIMQFSPTHRSISSSARERRMMDDEKGSILVRHNALRIYSRANPDFRVTCVINSEERALCTPCHRKTYHSTTPLQDQASASFNPSTGRSGI